jgi:hypothetical protein
LHEFVRFYILIYYMNLRKRFVTFLFAALFFIGLSGCKTTGLTKTQQIRQFEKMSWLLEKWQNISTEMTMTELWRKEMDTVYTATSVMMVGSDTVYHEEIRLAPNHRNIYYTITNISEGKSKIASYVLTYNQGGKIVFEDKANKAQSKISYIRKSHDNIFLEIYGLDVNEPNKMIYYLSRYK